jgi:hypothetical protein
MTRRRLSQVVVTAAALALAGCGSTASPGSTGQPRPARLPSLATSVLSQDGTSWAIVQMGGAAARQENFWQLFARPHGSATWQLATPAGVADNGGLLIAATGQQSALTGFRPSQDLKFSPLAATANGGRAWSATGPLQPGLANVADGLAAGPGGNLLAVTSTGAASSGDRGSAWTSLVSRSAIAGTAAGRGCGLTELTAAAFGSNGDPMLAGTCSRPGTVGIFDQSAGAWQRTGPRLPASLSGSDVAVLALATSGATTTAVLAAGEGRHASLVTAWLTGGAWTLSPAFRVRSLLPTSVSVWPSGAAGLVLPGGRGVVLSQPTKASPHGQWRLLPVALPAHTGTLAESQAGQLEALAAGRSMLTVWQLPAAPGHAARWQRVQTIKVTIPYGSSS